jgi:hypothetical protein
MLTPAPTQGDTSWFVHDRFGMFIHWGIYAVATRQAQDDAAALSRDRLTLDSRGEA